MAGISQVWLTAEELEAIAGWGDDASGSGPMTQSERNARAKIEQALAPVACAVASGTKTPTPLHGPLSPNLDQ